MPILLLLFCLVAIPVQAAGLVSKAATVELDLAFNPHPATGDLSLPLPCEGQMVFRAVPVSAKGLLWDVELALGQETSSKPHMEYYDRKFNANISAPFTAKDLPPAWQKQLPSSELPQFYYFLAKYEVSEYQWDAVMSGQCPQQITAQAARPKTNISWHDAQEFAKKYNLWLIANAVTALPKFANDARNLAFLRLPTEVEWEYAARGGNAVPVEVLRQEEFFPLESGKTLADYAVYRAEAGRIMEQPQILGSRLPNPLGLYDLAGNAAELVQDNFRFSLGGRLHGAIGGAMRKGGSFLSSAPEVMPGSREEVALFNERGEVRAKDLGLRLLLSGINTPGGGRSAALQAEWSKLGEKLSPPQLASSAGAPNAAADASKIITPADKVKAPGGAGIVSGGSFYNPLSELDKLLATTQDSNLKIHLTQLRASLKDNNIALERQSHAAAEGTVRTMLFLADSMRNLGIRHYISFKRLGEIKAEQAEVATKGTNPEYQKLAQTLDRNIKEYEEALYSFLDGLQAAGNFYKSKLQEANALPAEVLAYTLQLVAQDFKASSLFNQNMRENLAQLQKHLQTLEKNGNLTKIQIIKDILPQSLQKGLPWQ